MSELSISFLIPRFSMNSSAAARMSNRDVAGFFWRKLILIMSLIAAASVCQADDVILDDKEAFRWLLDNDYIDSNHVPKHNFYVFRSLLGGGESGPGGLKGIVAEGWSLSGPLNSPIKNPVIIVDERSLVGNSLKGKSITPSCQEAGFASKCTPAIFEIGRTFVCDWTGGCNDSVFTIKNIYGNGVEMYRADQSCPASPGLTASYSGTLTGRNLSGERKILNPGHGSLHPDAGNVTGFTCSF